MSTRAALCSVPSFLVNIIACLVNHSFGGRIPVGSLSFLLVSCCEYQAGNGWQLQNTPLGTGRSDHRRAALTVRRWGFGSQAESARRRGMLPPPSSTSGPRRRGGSRSRESRPLVGFSHCARWKHSPVTTQLDAVGAHHRRRERRPGIVARTSIRSCLALNASAAPSWKSRFRASLLPDPCTNRPCGAHWHVCKLAELREAACGGGSYPERTWIGPSRVSGGCAPAARRKAPRATGGLAVRGSGPLGMLQLARASGLAMGRMPGHARLSSDGTGVRRVWHGRCSPAGHAASQHASLDTHYRPEYSARGWR